MNDCNLVGLEGWGRMGKMAGTSSLAAKGHICDGCNNVDQATVLEQGLKDDFDSGRC